MCEFIVAYPQRWLQIYERGMTYYEMYNEVYSEINREYQNSDIHMINDILSIS